MAVDLPDNVSGALAAALPDLPALRRVAPDLMHVTLAFLARVPDEAVPTVAEAAREAATRERPFALVLARLGRFPGHGPPRSIWAGPERPSPQLERLGAAVRAALRRRRMGFDPKPLRPHVTLARLREGASASDIAAAIAVTAAPLVPLTLEVRRIGVIESRLSPKGPRYEVLGEMPLAADGL